MTPHDSFVQQMGPLLYQELLRTNTPNIDTAYDHMLRQLAYESDYGRSRVAKNQHNYGGYGWNGKTYTTFKDDADFVKHYVNLMNKRYGNAIAADTITNYAKALKANGYFEDSLDNYTRNLVGMRSLSKAATKHRLTNKDMYSIPMSKQSIVDIVDNIPQFEAQPLSVPVINTDYSLRNTPTQNPKTGSLNAWFGADSPSYGGARLRMPTLQEYANQIIFGR